MWAASVAMHFVFFDVADQIVVSGLLHWTLEYKLILAFWIQLSQKICLCTVDGWTLRRRTKVKYSICIFRLSNQKKYVEAINILHSGACKLLQKEQVRLMGLFVSPLTSLSSQFVHLTRFLFSLLPNQFGWIWDDGLWCHISIQFCSRSTYTIEE